MPTGDPLFVANAFTAIHRIAAAAFFGAVGADFCAFTASEAVGQRWQHPGPKARTAEMVANDLHFLIGFRRSGLVRPYHSRASL